MVDPLITTYNEAFHQHSLELLENIEEMFRRHYSDRFKNSITH